MQTTHSEGIALREGLVLGITTDDVMSSEQHLSAFLHVRSTTNQGSISLGMDFRQEEVPPALNPFWSEELRSLLFTLPARLLWPIVVHAIGCVFTQHIFAQYISQVTTLFIWAMTG